MIFICLLVLRVVYADMSRYQVWKREMLVGQKQLGLEGEACKQRASRFAMALTKKLREMNMQGLPFPGPDFCAAPPLHFEGAN